MVMKPRSAASRRHLSASPFNVQRPVDPVEQFAVQDRVTHDTFGLGRVAAVENDTAVTVDFTTTQVRFTTPFRKLAKL